MAISKVPSSGITADFDNSLTTADLAPNSVDSSELVDGSIDTSHLSSNIAISTSGAITTTGAFTSVGIDDNAAGAVAITIDSSERVGIGETAPDAVMEIKNSTQNQYCLHLSNSENQHTGYSDGLCISAVSGQNSNALYIESGVASGGAPESGDVRMVVTGGGLVGIGTAAPAHRLEIKSAGHGTTPIQVLNSQDTDPIFQVYESSSGDGYNGLLYLYDGAGNNDVKISTNGDSWFKGGEVGIGITPAHPLDVLSAVGGDYITRFRNSSTNVALITQMKYSDYSPDDNTARFLDCYDSTTLRCKIASDGDLTNHDNSYGAISDERIKTDIKDANSQWDDIKAIKVRNFKRKDDVRQYGENAWEQIGVIAQEVEAAGMDKLIREGNPDDFQMEHCGFGTLIEATYYEAGDDIPEGASIGDIKEKAKWIPKKDEDGKDVTVKSMSYSVLYMKAIKALQEAMTRIEALEAA